MGNALIGYSGTQAAPSNGLAVSGNVGIGTSLPTALGHVYNTGSGTSFRVDDAAADTTPFVVTADGNVGIGTATPGATFEVRNSLAPQ